MPQYVCGDLSTTFRSQVSPSTIWVPKIQLMRSDVIASAFKDWVSTSARTSRRWVLWRWSEYWGHCFQKGQCYSQGELVPTTVDHCKSVSHTPEAIWLPILLCDYFQIHYQHWEAICCEALTRVEQKHEPCSCISKISELKKTLLCIYTQPWAFCYSNRKQLIHWGQPDLHRSSR